MKRTRENPIWVHFGGGNIFRAFIGRAVSGLLEQGKLDRGLIVAESFDWTLIDEIYLKHDLVSLAVTVDGNGENEKKRGQQYRRSASCRPGMGGGYETAENDFFPNRPFSWSALPLRKKATL